MPQYKIKLKWGRECFEDVDINTDEPPLLFRAQVYALTGIPPSRQKILCKGKSLKENEWDDFHLKNNTTILLVGSPEVLPRVPAEKAVFVEDMNDTEVAATLNLPAGLKNLGNTCYLNATVQCLKTVPELQEAIKKYTGDASGQTSHSMVLALKSLYSSMTSGTTAHPLMLLQIFHMAIPRFAEKNDQGYIQQDANEFWTELVRILQQRLICDDPASKHKSIIDQYFGGTYDVELKCEESQEEAPTNSEEQFLQLSCFISQDIKYMHSGLKSKIAEKIIKHSATLDRNAVYTKTSKIKRLPAYLTIQFVRFFYKEKESINAKILKNVKFPIDYDAYELCSEELQKKLEPARLKFKELEDLKAGETNKVYNNGDIREKIPTKEKKYESYWLEDDLGSNNSGYYTLQAVLTHKGRSSSSGHYVGWIKVDEDKWVKCDDDNVSFVSVDEILKLSGGGDWHCAYVLLYGPKRLEILDGTEKVADSPLPEPAD